jgi:hypothetical protein
MSPAKATRIWVSWQVGERDYFIIRERLFAQETVDIWAIQSVDYLQLSELAYKPLTRRCRIRRGAYDFICAGGLGGCADRQLVG